MDKWLIRESENKKLQQVLIMALVMMSIIPIHNNNNNNSGEGTAIDKGEGLPNNECEAQELHELEITNNNSDNLMVVENLIDDELGHCSPSKRLKVHANIKQKSAQHTIRLSKFCNSWLKEPEFAKWLAKSKRQKKGHEYALCKICNCDIIAHRNDIRRHRVSEKHKYNYNTVVNATKITDTNFLTVDDSIKRAELKLCSLLASNNISFLFMDTLCPLMSDIFPDSKIASSIAMKRTKATTVLKENLASVFKNELYEIVAKPGQFFSLIMDETTDRATKKQCAFTIIYFCEKSNKVVTKFFDMVEMLNGSNASELYKCLKQVIVEKNIPFSNLVGFSSDTTNVMFGEHNSVYTLLKSDLPNVVCVKCSCHMIHLAASKACKILPRSVEDLLRNVGSHFNRSSGRTERFKEFQEFFNTEIHKILLPAMTRWLSMKQCVDRILEQYDPLEAYFREEVFRDPSKTTEEILDTFSNKFTRMYLEFMSYILGLLTEFNKLFQFEVPTNAS
ncbi:hypothetical protein NQ315_002594 [Exocentrus adspersus]|uniref:DUF4371 domain-containing protein n=1 Tax=Exocentrus adspersus TaxID=1586481 RepID=A0AAV8VVG9_9CUCU|nr:hypothetical protein NQ315_002594 [Exocentrus adspersus]